MIKESFLSKEYLVSDDGTIFSKRGKPLKPSINHKGYEMVNLLVNGRRIGIAVHTLVARAFCEGYTEGYTVNHKDGNKLNNCSSNLEWITSYDNTRHAIEVLHKDNSREENPSARPIYAYSKDTHILIYTFDCIMSAAEFFEPNASYARLRGIQNSIWRAANGVRKSYKGFIWKYK